MWCLGGPSVRHRTTADLTARGRRDVGSRMPSFEGEGRLVVQRGMSASSVIEAFDKVEDGETGDRGGRQGHAIEQFALECGEEALAHRIVKAVADRSHRGTNPGVVTAPPEVDGRVLGEFNRSLQQLSKGKLQWVLRDNVGLIARAEARSALQVVRRRDAVNTDNGSGGPSRVGCRVGMPHARLASRNRSAPGGSERMAACRQPI
jgi:hypothetical protein